MHYKVASSDIVDRDINQLRNDEVKTTLDGTVNACPNPPGTLSNTLLNDFLCEPLGGYSQPKADVYQARCRRPRPIYLVQGEIRLK